MMQLKQGMFLASAPGGTTLSNMAPPLAKTWLVVKPDYLEEAVSAFSNTNIRITCDGRPYLGSALGSQKYTEEFVNSKVKQWITEVQNLSNIAKSQPHAAFTAFTHGLEVNWSYISHTIPNISNLLRPLENAILFRFPAVYYWLSTPKQLHEKITDTSRKIGRSRNP